MMDGLEIVGRSDLYEVNASPSKPVETFLFAPSFSHMLILLPLPVSQVLVGGLAGTWRDSLGQFPFGLLRPPTGPTRVTQQVPPPCPKIGCFSGVSAHCSSPHRATLATALIRYRPFLINWPPL